jgi:hypothetical protein
MSNIDHKAKTAILLNLFDGFRASISEQTAEIYALAVETCSLEAVECAITEYLQGKVPSHDGKRCPTSAEFAKRARLMDDALAIRAAREANPVPALPSPDAYTVDKAMRKKVSALLLDLAAKMRDRLDDEDRRHARKVFRADAETTGDPRPLAERLGLA